MRSQRLPKDQYEALKKFKKMVNNERANKLVKDHSGHLYRINANGSLERLTREEMLQISGKSN